MSHRVTANFKVSFQRDEDGVIFRVDARLFTRKDAERSFAYNLEQIINVRDKGMFTVARDTFDNLSKHIPHLSFNDIAKLSVLERYQNTMIEKRDRLLFHAFINDLNHDTDETCTEILLNTKTSTGKLMIGLLSTYSHLSTDCLAFCWAFEDEAKAEKLYSDLCVELK